MSIKDFKFFNGASEIVPLPEWWNDGDVIEAMERVSPQPELPYTILHQRILDLEEEIERIRNHTNYWD